jgi:hypothetical protein
MSFALPIALSLAALAIPILILYILKVRMRRIPVSTNLFWRQIYDEKPPRSIWQNLRHLLSLLAQLLLLALLVLAIADPYMPWQLMRARRIVLVIDNSASMKATDVVPTRLDAAKSFAQDFISGLRERDEVAIVLGGSSPEVVMGMTGHLPTLRRAIESIQPSDNPTELDAAVRLGEKLVGDHPHGQVIVLTDGCFKEPAVEAVAVEASNKVTYQIFGTAADNVGITQFQTRRSLTDPLGYEILAAVFNASDASLQCRLELTLDDVPIDVVPLDLSPGEEWKKSFEKTSIDGGVVVARLTNLDGQRNVLDIDDVALAVLPARTIQKVMIVSAGNLFLRKVFEANPLVELTVVDTFPATWPTDTLIVLHQEVPESLPDGNVMVIDPVADTEFWKVSGMIDNPIITEQAEDSPLMTHIRLDNVFVPEAVRLDFNAKTLALAQTVSGDAIYSQVTRDNGRLLVLSANLEQSDLAFRTSFPIMVTNALTWFGNQSGELQPSLATGSLLPIELHDNTVSLDESLRLQSPDDKMMDVATTDDGKRATIGPLDRAGIWKLSKFGVDEIASAEVVSETEVFRQVAVNLANKRESDLRPLERYSTESSNEMLVSRWFSRPIWFYLTLLASIFVGTEWFLYQRRFIS